jgi:transcriptional regulator with XRE-family HTH domain
MIKQHQIKRIKELRAKGSTIEEISKKMDMSTRTIQKYLKADLKEPVKGLLIDTIEALKSIIAQHEKRIKVLEEIAPDTVKVKEFISTRFVPDGSTRFVPDKSTRFVPDRELKKGNPIKGKDPDFPELDIDFTELDKITENNEKAVKRLLEDEADNLDMAEDTTLKEYYTVKEAEAVTGNKARYLQKKLQTLGYEKVKGHYRIPVKDIGRFKKQRKHKGNKS